MLSFPVPCKTSLIFNVFISIYLSIQSQSFVSTVNEAFRIVHCNLVGRDSVTHTNFVCVRGPFLPKSNGLLVRGNASLARFLSNEIFAIGRRRDTSHGLKTVMIDWIPLKDIESIST